jgi:hypothetical protein
VASSPNSRPEICLDATRVTPSATGTPTAMPIATRRQQADQSLLHEGGTHFFFQRP